MQHVDWTGGAGWEMFLIIVSHKIVRRKMETLPIQFFNEN